MTAELPKRKRVKQTSTETAPANPPQEKTYDLNLIPDQVSMFRDNLEQEQIAKLIADHIQSTLNKYDLSKYKVIFLFDEYNSISSTHSDKIYRAISDLNQQKDILMIIESGGGKIEPAYLISKTCKRLAKNKFVVSVPRRAKSAATLISLGAHEIHMGLLSELGPIDPQFGGFPALGLANAVEKIAAMTEKFPASSDMLAKYLTNNVDIKTLGYFERINESATQYAIRLLRGKTLPKDQSCESLADHFTNHYKDHGFVIDSDEASDLLGKEVIKEGEKEYLAGNEIYEFLHFISFLYSVFKEKNIRYIGNISNGLDVIDKIK